MKTNRRKQLIAVLLVLAVSLSTASCSTRRGGQPEAMVPAIVQEPISMPTVPEVTGEPAEPQMMAPVEGNEPSIPAESAPPATKSHATQTEPNSYPTEPPTTEPSVIPTEPPVEEQQPSIPAETVPPVTQPPTIPTEPPATEPPAVPTEPPATDPPATEPIGCQHTWQSVQHPEEGHYVGYAVCKCGYRCNGANDWFSHRDSFSLEDALVYHTSYGVGEDYIVDSPADTTWVCTRCGADSDTQP